MYPKFYIEYYTNPQVRCVTQFYNNITQTGRLHSQSSEWAVINTRRTFGFHFLNS